MNTKIYLSLLSTSAFFAQANADSSYDIKGVISPDQMETIIATQLRDAPSGTKVTDVEYLGFFSVNESRYLATIDMNVVKYKIKTKLGIISISSDVAMSIAASFPDLNCNNPVITRLSVTASNPLLEGEIRKEITKKAESIVRDGYIVQSDLIKYCKVKPQ